METILRSTEMAEIVFLPIRHHSPVCARHVQKLIRLLSPSAILIEGPETANRLIPVLVHEDTKPPLALYYSYRDSMAVLSENKEDYKCYYPFLNYSPELVALREGNAFKIPTAFIDLPYGEILAASAKGRGLLKEGEKINYNDDYLLTNNAYLRELCIKTGMGSFDEFWEKYFELKGVSEDSGKLFSHIYTYCCLARENTPEHVLQEEGCLAREAYMAEKIIAQVQQHASRIEKSGPVLVITGGFHTPGLIKLVQQSEQQKKMTLTIPEKEQQVYAMPYSMEAADALNGYASGMPFPEFYQEVWENMEEEAPYSKAVLNMMVKTGREVRKKGGAVSAYDEICGYTMAEGLANLRGKPEPGAYELLDAVLSSFVKGEYNLSTDMPVKLLRKHMTGTTIGALCSDAEKPPVVQDFEEHCRHFGMKLHSTLEQEVTLSIFTSPKHRQMSMFFYRMYFLDTGFVKKIKGPNLKQKRDKNLMREIWKYKWSVHVTSALIDVSVHGATIAEVCHGLVKKRLQQDLGAKEAAILLTSVFEMGIEEQLTAVYACCYDLILQDSDFYSLAGALSYFMMLEELECLYHSGLKLEALTTVCLQRLIVLLPAMGQIKEEQLLDCMQACKLLYQVTGRVQYYEERLQYTDILSNIIERTDIHPGVHGCMLGILYGCGKVQIRQVETACRGYLTGTREQLLQTAQFFRGLFYTARDLIFIGTQFLEILDRFFDSVEDESFLALLPDLKMAFGYFTPSEIDCIAGTVAKLHGKPEENILQRAELLPGWSSYGKELEAYAMANMPRYTNLINADRGTGHGR